MIKEISEGLGLQTMSIDLDVVTDPIILGEEFDYVICIRSGSKGVKCDELDIALFWWYLEKEINPYNGRPESSTKVPVLVHEFQTKGPIEIPPDEERFFNLHSRADPDFKYSRKKFGWFFKVHADIPWAPDERKKFPIDILPKFTLSSALIALTRNMGYSEDKERRDGDEGYCRYRLLPPENMSSFIKFLDLEVEDRSDGTMKIQLELELWYDKEQNPWIEEDTRTVIRKVYLNKGELIRMDGSQNLERIVKLLRETILFTINQFLEDPYIDPIEEM